MKKLLLAALCVFLFSCSKDDDTPITTNPTTPVTPEVINIDYHKRENGVTDTIRYVGTGTFTYLSSVKINNNEGTSFNYMTQSRLSKLTNYNLNTNKVIKKELIYNNNIGQVAKITSIITNYYDIIGGNTEVLTAKVREDLTYNVSGKIVTIIKQNLNISDDSVINSKNYEITLNFEDVGGYVYKSISSIKDITNNTITNFTYDGKYNMYSKCYSISDLSLCYWEDMKYTRSNIIIKETSNLSTNVVTESKTYTITYIGDLCKKRIFSNIILDEYFYKNN